MNAEQIRNSWDDDHDVTQPCAFPEPLAEVLTRENRELRAEVERLRSDVDRMEDQVTLTDEAASAALDADELRQAAATLRRLAPEQPFKSETACAWDTGHRLQRDDGSWIVWTPRTYAKDERDDYRTTAAYFALMHPGVGLALADWLDGHTNNTDGRIDPEAITLARLINGGAS